MSESSVENDESVLTMSFLRKIIISIAHERTSNWLDGINSLQASGGRCRPDKETHEIRDDRPDENEKTDLPNQLSREATKMMECPFLGDDDDNDETDKRADCRVDWSISFNLRVRYQRQSSSEPQNQDSNVCDSNTIQTVHIHGECHR